MLTNLITPLRADERESGDLVVSVTQCVHSFSDKKRAIADLVICDKALPLVIPFYFFSLGSVTSTTYFFAQNWAKSFPTRHTKGYKVNALGVPFLAIRLRTRKQYKTLPYARLYYSFFQPLRPQKRAFFLQSANPFAIPN
jgi:hypothetical protein